MLLDLIKRKKHGKAGKEDKTHVAPAVQKKVELNTHSCPKCSAKVEENVWNLTNRVCEACGYHGRIGARTRINIILDTGTFVEVGKNIVAKDPLGFPDYTKKLEQAAYKTRETESVVAGMGKIEGIPVAIFAMDPDFMMGSLGSATGERIAQIIEKAIENKVAVIAFCASGGARMQEGILSLMQMAKTASALGKLGEAGLPYFSVLTDPTTGGVTASFAMLGDVIISEPGALIGFAGQRVIEQTIRQKLPDGFQRAEFLVEKGFVDRIIPRSEMKSMLYKLLTIHGFKGGEAIGADTRV